VLTSIEFPTLTYTVPNAAKQKPGPLPYGSTLIPPGILAPLDGGDNRILSLSYAGGRLYATLGTRVTDSGGNALAGGAYFVVSPIFRGGTLSVFVLRQGYLMVEKNNLLRSAVAVNAAGKGAVALTLVGPAYYPSAAFVPIQTFATDSTLRIAAPGVAPEDGFTGYPDQGFPAVGLARWGDDTAVTVASDGSIWMATEFIPGGTRTLYANWGTYITHFIP
jgi:hypothetical protein